MSTNSLVGVYSADKGLTFKAQYCHWDGYPSGVGKALWCNWLKAFKGDTQKLADFVLRSRFGWSVLANTDFTLSPVWVRELPQDEQDKYRNHPEWYDTRDRTIYNDVAEYITHETYQQWMGIEWCYLIDLKRNVIDVYKVTLKQSLILVGTMSRDSEPDYAELEDWKK